MFHSPDSVRHCHIFVVCHLHLQPERIHLQSNGGYDVRADIWSVGISLAQLATGTLPYSHCKFATEFQLLTYIVQAPPPLPDKASYSPQFYDFLSQWCVCVCVYLVLFVWVREKGEREHPFLCISSYWFPIGSAILAQLMPVFDIW